jgi:hypothetical protein
MSCSELLKRFTEMLEKDEVNWELLNKIMNKCGVFFVREAGRAFAKKVVNYYMSFAWRYYKGAAIAGKPPVVAYGEAVYVIWRLWDWYSIHCGPLADIAVYIAEAAASYKWPSRWPFLASPAVAAEEKGCDLPDSVAEALGADEYARLEAFLEQGEGVVEIAGQKIALVRDGRYISIVVAV